MKIFLTAFCVFSLFFSGCTKDIEPAPVPNSSRVDKTVELPRNKSVVRKNNTVLKEENRIPSGEEVCEIPGGCAIDEVGKCIGCVTKKRDIATLDYSAGTLRTGDYRITTQIQHTGKTIRWTVPLNMSLRNISKRTYLMTFTGIGEVEGITVDCSDPFVAIFTIDENNEETSFKVLDKGSCPEVVSENWKVKWESNEYGLKKMKSYSTDINSGRRAVCHVGPCDWISTMVNVYFYEFVK